MDQKRGRPKAENPKSVDIKVRLDQRTADKLDDYCEKEKIQRATAIRTAIESLLDRSTE